MTTAALLETEGLSKTFGGLEAVSDVSVAVPQGRVLGIIGPNGAGKTTLINLITGHLSPTSGRVVIDGRDLTGHRPWDVARAGVARTFQIVKPFRAMTVGENVAMGAMFSSDGAKSVREGLERSEAILSRVGLEGKGTSRPGELSVADTKRLELAKALAMRPRLLLLDEVMAGLRPNEVNDSVELIKGLQSEGMTIIAIEHVMKAIMAISDEVFVLHEGRELAKGPPQEIAHDQRVIEAYLGERYARRQKEQGDDQPEERNAGS